MTTLQWVAMAGFIASLVAIVRNTSLGGLLESNRRQHLVFGAAAAVFTLWLFRAGIYEGLNVHFLWLVALTLTMGFRYAVVTATIALLGVTIIGLESWSMFGVNGLLGLLAPIGTAYLIFMVTFHRLPRHLFVYIFVCAFFPGALCIALKMALMGGYYYLDGFHSWTVVQDNFLVLIPLMLFPEGMLNGMTMTLLVIYKPHWVYTFHDKFYIDNQ